MLKFFGRSLRHSACFLLVSAASTSLPLLFSYLILALSSPLYLFLNLSGRKCFLSPPVLSGYNGSPDTRFSRRTTRLMSGPDGERYLFPQQSLIVSLLLSLVSTLLFSRTGGLLSHQNSSTHRYPRFLLKNLCFYVMLAVFSLAFAAMDTVFCHALISLELAESKIFPAAPADTRPKTPLISFCTVQLRTLCVARSLAIFCLSTTSGLGHGEFPGFWGLMVFRHQPIPRKGLGNNNNSKTEITDALLRNKS